MLSLVLLLACGGPVDDKDPAAETDTLATSDADDDGVAAPDDCDDTDPTIFPGAPDAFGDDKDADCSGLDGVDADGDAFADGPDCNDGDATVNPQAVEIAYNGIDENCNGKRDDGDVDGDGEKAVAVGGIDCDDADPNLIDQTNRITSASPADGTADVLPSTFLELRLATADPTVTVTVTDATGATIPGQTGVQGDYVRFIPDAPWAVDQTYSVTVDTLCSTLTLGFGTSTLGQPVPDLNALVGTTWKLDVRTGTVTAPPLFGGLILLGLGGYQIVSVQAVRGDQLDLLWTTVGDTATAQNTCLPALPLAAPMDASANPTVRFEPDAFWYLGAQASPGASVMTGLLRADGSGLARGRWTIATDLRETGAIFGAGSATTLCRLFGTAGLNCGTCPDGVQACLNTVIDDIEMTPAPFGIVPRSVADILADPVCTPQPPVDTGDSGTDTSLADTFPTSPTDTFPADSALETGATAP
ncbi:MAG: hypothetical protein RLZZ383_1903 [Pseudomonadota bacterium]|jgi:hypothetical protein